MPHPAASVVRPARRLRLFALLAFLVFAASAGLWNGWSGTSARADELGRATAVSGEDDDYRADDFIPVLIVQRSASLAQTGLEGRLMSAATRAIQRAALKTLAPQIFGTGAHFSGRRTTVPGPVTNFLQGMSYFDDFLNEEMAFDNLREQLVQHPAPSDENLTVEFMFVPRTVRDHYPAAFSSIQSQFLGAPLAMLWEIARNSQRLRTEPRVAQLLTHLTNFSTLDVSKLPGGHESLFVSGEETFEWANYKADKIWVPIYLRFVMQIVGSSITFDFLATLKPGAIPDQTKFSKKGPFLVQAVRFRPTLHRPGHRNIFQLSFHRAYGANVDDRPQLYLSFGRMVGRDVRAMKVCLADCGPENLYEAPTIVLLVRPLADAPSFVPGFLRESRLRRNFYVLLNRLSIDLRDVRGMCIEPKASMTPLLVQRKRTHADDSFLVFGQNPSFVGIVSDADIFEEFSKQLAAQLSKEIHYGLGAQLQEKDQSASEALGRAFDYATRFFRD